MAAGMSREFYQRFGFKVVGESEHHPRLVSADEGHRVPASKQLQRTVMGKEPRHMRQRAAD